MFKRIFKWQILALLAVIALAAAYGVAQASTPQYAPQARNLTITAVPLGVHEMQDSLNYLKVDFASGGILDGKEVYGFSPSTITVFKGDTLNLTLVNPGDDDHTFTLSGYGVDSTMTGKTITKVSFVANKAGIYSFYCEEAEHAPFMWGQLVVLPASQAVQ